MTRPEAGRVAEPASAHRARVNAWMERGAASLSGARLIEAFGEAFGAIWWRAHATLGDVTLVAIGDRVLHTATERHPFLAKVTLDAGGLHTGELRANAREIPQRELGAAIRFVLEEFLSVVGNLTADILTPALHAQLDKHLPAEDVKT